MRMAYAHKRRRHTDMVPPTKFLLGGCITDPLNLNSLQDEEVNRALNQVTPESSPLPTPKHRKEAIEVLIPPNINDPLNLNSENDGNVVLDTQYWFVNKRKRKSKKSKKPTELLNPESVVEKPQSVEKPEEIIKIEEESGKEKEKKARKDAPKDKIVSPVVPQPGTIKRPNCSNNNKDEDFRPPAKKRKKLNYPNKDESSMHPNKHGRFRYGNYNQYYGKRNASKAVDKRLSFFKHEWFYMKDVLDIGCNIGHVTLLIARDFAPKKILGIDIDSQLIKIAQKNIKHYLPQEDLSVKYPVSMKLLYGSLVVPNVPEKKEDLCKFPFNVEFTSANYVPDEADLETIQPEYDVILGLSITKWLHLNWGDEGLKRAFKKMYKQLRIGGRLILEPQNWDSYKKKKNIIDTINENYKNIKFLPHKFSEYLLTEVGFSSCEVIGVPMHLSKGFCRPLQMYVKGEYKTQSCSMAKPTQNHSLNLGSGSGHGCVKSDCDSNSTINSDVPAHCDTSLIKQSSDLASHRVITDSESQTHKKPNVS